VIYHRGLRSSAEGIKSAPREGYAFTNVGECHEFICHKIRVFSRNNSIDAPERRPAGVCRWFGDGVRGVLNKHCLHTPPIWRSELLAQESLDRLGVCGDVDRFTGIDQGHRSKRPRPQTAAPSSNILCRIGRRDAPDLLAPITIRRDGATIQRIFQYSAFLLFVFGVSTLSAGHAVYFLLRYSIRLCA